jgi:putative flippase GtrA
MSVREAPGGRFSQGRPEQVRFLVAGSLAALVNWLARFPLEGIMPYWAAVLGALAIGMIFGFWIYETWVFPGSPRPIGRKIRDFLAVNAVTQAVMFVVAVGLRTLAVHMGFDVHLSGAGAHFIGIATGAVVSFLGHRKITFGRGDGNA